MTDDRRLFLVARRRMDPLSMRYLTRTTTSAARVLSPITSV